MSRLTMAAAALSLLTITAMQARQAAAPPTLEALDGVDVVVLLAQDKEVFGKSAFKSTHGRFDYLFSSAQTKAEFDKAPGKYAIQMGGLCARMAKTVQGSPSDYAVHDGRIFIFASDNCRTLFVRSPAKYLDRPALPMPDSPEASAKGRALLDKAAAAHGAQPLDGATHYSERTRVVQKRSKGEVSIVTRVLHQFPDAARMERTVPLQSGPATFTTLLTAGRAWALAPVTVAGQTMERVRMRRGGLDVSVNIEPASARVHSISFVDRNSVGEVGDVRSPSATSGTSTASPSRSRSRRPSTAFRIPRSRERSRVSRSRRLWILRCSRCREVPNDVHLSVAVWRRDTCGIGWRRRVAAVNAADWSWGQSLNLSPPRFWCQRRERALAPKR